MASEPKETESANTVLTFGQSEPQQGLPPDLLDSELEEQDLDTLAEFFDNVEDYIDAFNLSLDETNNARALAHVYSTKGAIIKCLSVWRELNRFAATYRALLDILNGLNKEEVVYKVLQYLSSKRTHLPSTTNDVPLNDNQPTDHGAISRNYGHQVLVKCGQEVTQALSRDPESAASLLHSRGFISDHMLEEVVELNVTKADNGRRLYTAVLGVVKSFPQRYTDLVTVFEERGRLYSDLLTLLRGTYQELDHTHCETDDSTRKRKNVTNINEEKPLSKRVKYDSTIIDTDHESPEEIDDSTISASKPEDISDLKAQIDILENKFLQLATKALERLETRGVTLGTFYGKVSCMKHDVKRVAGTYFEECFDKVASFSSLAIFWGKLNRFWDFFNYELFQHVVRVMFSEDEPLHSKLAEYEDEISRFLSSTKLCDFCEVWPFSIDKPQKKEIGQLKSVVVKVNRKWEECTLHDVKNISDTFAQGFFLPREFLLLAGMSKSSVSILWYVPPSLASSIVAQVKAKVGFLARNSFQSIVVNDYEFITPETTRQLFLHLQTMYTTRFTPVKSAKRDLMPFKLALILKQKANKYNRDAFTKQSLRGDKDDIMYMKLPLDLHSLGYLPDGSLPRLVLVEGLPGSGKTTFSREFSLKWASGAVFTDSILILLPLRDYNVRKVSNLQELLAFIKPGDGSLEGELETSKGEGLTFWLDGWDELASTLDATSIYQHLISGEILPQARVIVSSRHWATGLVKEQLDRQPSQHIEIVSSFQDQINWLTELKDREQASPSKFSPLMDSFMSYLEETPVIRCNMHTPLATEITLLVYRSCIESDSPLPTTTTQLYSCYTRLCVHKYLDNHSHFSSKLWKSDHFSDLPAPLNMWFVSLCHLAFDGLFDGQRLVFPNVPSHLRLETLELMQAQDPLYGSEESAVVSYHYNHLTLQEFLAALSLLSSWTSDKKNSEIVQEHVNDGQFTIVLRFLSGLAKSYPVLREHIMRMLDSNADKLTVFHWLYEASNASIADILGEKEIRVRSDYSWSILDYYVCGYCIVHSNCHWNISFGAALMGDEKMTQFLQAIKSASVNHGNACITSIDFSVCKLTSQSLCHLPDIPAPFLRHLKSFNLKSNNLDRTAVDYITKALPHMPQLEKLDLSNNHNIQRGGTVSLVSALCEHRALKEITLLGTSIGEEDCVLLARLLSASTSLESLRVGSKNFTSKSVSILFQALKRNSSLTDLQISPGDITLKAMNILSAYLQDNEKCKLMYLALKYCNISPDTAVELAQGLSQNCSVKELELYNNDISNEGAAALGQALTENKTLTKLDLSKCSITTTGGAALASSLLLANSTLEELDISGNSLGGEAINSFTRLLEHNKTLKILDIGEDKFLDKTDVDALLTSLKSNQTLRELRLPSNCKLEGDIDERVQWL